MNQNHMGYAMKLLFMFSALLLSALSVSAGAEESDPCKATCNTDKGACRAQAERASQKDVDIPFWARNRKTGQSTFSKHNTPEDSDIPQQREDNYRQRRMESLSRCEDKYATCTYSCAQNTPRDTVFKQ